ncbi:MAG: hypothetical protein Q8P41_30300 [Pseudomonadota bacterium]|nr:hypothetical protein [Pseudomonadota bacterium]
MTVRLALVLLLPLALAACAARTPGAKPHDMGETQHEAEAGTHEQAATTHAEQFDPNAPLEKDLCGAGKGRRPCWTNPTEAHLRESEQHRRMAADHRAASEALREAEASACVGLDPADVDLSPFEQYSADIASVEPLVVHRGGKTPEHRIVGATVTVRAVEGLTAEWLQRVVDCHVARNAAVGHDMPEMPSCPLVPKGATATVSSTGTGFAVAIRSDDSAAAEDILARAKRLAPAASSTTP